MIYLIIETILLIGAIMTIILLSILLGIAEHKIKKAIEITKKEKEIMGYAKYDSCLLLIENILQNGSEVK